MFSAYEARLVDAILDAYFPPGGPLAISGREAGGRRRLSSYFQRMPRRARRLLRLLLWFTELSPLVFGPRRRRFTRLTAEQRCAFLAGAAASPLYGRRVAFLSLRAIVTMAYLADPRVVEAIGMAPDLDPFQLGRSGGELAPPPAVSGTRLKRRSSTSEARRRLRRRGA
ncbi:MAG: hypothetical protein KC731_37165, partial [Myxococcales bacterium]|nr:hypothetical protein [Myxococcales bacterium]